MDSLSNQLSMRKDNKFILPHRTRKSLLAITFCICCAILYFVRFYFFVDESYNSKHTNEEIKKVIQTPAKVEKKNDLTGRLNPKKNNSILTADNIQENVINQENETIPNESISNVPATSSVSNSVNEYEFN